MLKEIFDIGNFNIFSDEENYYFFRALNMADNSDINNNITFHDGQIERIRTDRERYDGTEIYSENSEISLMEMFDHIKMHYDKTTNCISLTSNANAAIVYGRGNYTDKYVVVKVPKEELGKKVYNAGLYLLEEINKMIDAIMASGELDDYDMQKYFYDAINNAKSQKRLDEIKLVLPKEYSEKTDIFVGGLELDFTNTREYQALNEKQNLEKNKTVMKLDILNRQLLPTVSNRYLIQTVGNAFSSLELIHYKDILGENIIEVPKEIMDVLSLVQQLPSSLEYVEEVKQILIEQLAKIDYQNEFSYQNSDVDEKLITLDEMYSLTDGKFNYKTANETYKKIFYLAKSKLRAYSSANLLNQILNNNPKYNELISYVKYKTYGIEPQITTKVSNNLHVLSESVSLDFKPSEEDLFKYINTLDTNSLISILNNPNDSIKQLLNDFIVDYDVPTDKEEWYANSIIDLLDWKSFGVRENLSSSQRKDIIKALKEHNFMDIYYQLKEENISEKDISKALFSMLIKEENIDLKSSFTLEELEWFIGYNRVKGTKLKLKKYQKPILNNIDKILSEKQFASAILPTGTGKSYIAIAEMYEHRDEEILYLAPNREILNQLIGIIKDAYNPEEHIGETDIDVVKRIFPKLTLATYQDLKDKTENNIKEKYSNNYGLIVFDELHRTGAKEWKEQVTTLLDNQNENVKVLGVTATPERDMDLKDMTDHWAQYFGYSDEEILKQKHIAVNMDIIDAIKTGIVANPRVVNCEYTLISDGSLDELKLSIENIADDNLRSEEIKKYEDLRRRVENSDGIEKVIRENLKKDGKYIIFLPITKKDNGEYEDEDGNKVDKSTAERVIKDYQALVKQYIFSYDYLNEENNRVREIYNKIINNKKIDNIDIEYLNHEKDNILLLSKIDIQGKPSALNTETNVIADTIIKYMNFERLSISEQTKKLGIKTKDILEDYSMLGSYTQEKNNRQLSGFNEETKGKMKLMFVMNKLNEGVHAKGVNGIVWLRPLASNSKILYLQQLGRCISALHEGKVLAEEDRPLVLDLVNNTLNVKMDKGLSQEELDLLKLNVILMWVNDNNGRLPNLDSSQKQESEYAKRLILINKRYSKYNNNVELLKNENVNTRILIEEIIKVGASIGLWQMDVPYIESVREKQDKPIISDDDVLFKTTGIIRDFVELQQDIQGYGIFTNDELTEQYIKYLYVEDKEKNKKKGYVSPDDKTPIGNTTMGIYLNNEKYAVKKLIQRKELEEELTEEEKVRIGNYDRIIEVQNQIRMEDQILLNNEVTEQYINYLYVEDKGKKKKKGYVDRNDKTPIGNTTMGIYLNSEQQAVKKLTQKKEQGEELTEEEKVRIGNYDRIIEVQKQIRMKGQVLLTEQYISYLYVEDIKKNKRKGYISPDDKTPIGNTTMGKYLSSEQQAVKKLTQKKEQVEELTEEEKVRIDNYDKIIEVQNQIRMEDQILLNNELTEQYISYLYVEDIKKKKRKGYISPDDKTPIGNTTMGTYYYSEQQAVKKLTQKKEQGEELTEEGKVRIGNYDRIIEVQKQIRMKGQVLLTEQYISYLYVEDIKKNKRKGYISPDDKTPIGNTTMGKYLNIEQRAVKKLIQKKEQGEELTEEEKVRIGNYNKILEVQNIIRRKLKSEYDSSKEEFDEISVFKQAMSSIKDKENDNDNGRKVY